MSQPQQPSKEIEQGLAIALGLSRAVVQEYLAYLQGVKAEALFDEVQTQSGEVGFQNKAGLLYYMRLAVIDDSDCTYKFPIEKCPGREVSEAHDRMLLNAKFVTKYLLDSEINKSALSRPELFEDARLCFTPHKTAFLFNNKHGKEMHDRFTKRIAVIWSREAKTEADMESTVATAPAHDVKQRADMSTSAHPDDWTGPKNAKPMNEDEISDLISKINMGRCRVCGTEESVDGKPTCTCL